MNDYRVFPWLKHLQGKHDQSSHGGAKESWEMTRAEFEAARNSPRVAAIQQAIRDGRPIVLGTQYRATRIAKPEHIRMDVDGTVRISAGKRWVALVDAQVESLAAQAGVKPVPFEERVYHHAVVKEALAAGKPVPEAVLAEYPDLLRRKVKSKGSGRKEHQGG